MVAYGLGVIPHVVDDACCQILVLGHHEIRPVDARLTLQDVAVVYQQQVVAVLLAFFINISIGAHQSPFQGLPLRKVPGEEMPVYVAGLYHLQLHRFIAFRSTRHCQGTHH